MDCAIAPDSIATLALSLEFGLNETIHDAILQIWNANLHVLNE